MSNEIQKTDEPTISKRDEEILRGTASIGAFRDELELRGFRVPSDYKFKALDRNSVSAATSAVFELLGGVPAFALWAAENPGKFFELFAKQNQSLPPSLQVNAQKIEIVSPLGASPLDDIELDDLGRVKGSDDISDIL